MASILGSAVLEYVSIRERKVWKGERLKPVSSFSVFGFFFVSGVFGWISVSSDIPTLSSAYQHVNHYSLVFNCFLS